MRQRFQFFHISLHGVRKIVEFERQQIRIGQSHDCGSGGLRQRAAIHKIRIAEMREPVEIIVNRMVDSAAVFAAKAQIQRSDSVMLKESAVVGT